MIDDIPLPPEPEDPDPPEVADRDAPPALPPLTAEDYAAAAQVHAAARRVHVAQRREFGRLGHEFDPRGRHVGCDGDPPGAGGCRAAPGEACKHPLGKFVSGFVHPSRVAAERRVFGMDA